MADSIHILESRNPYDVDAPQEPERLPGSDEQLVYNTFHVSPELRQKAYEINLRLQGKHAPAPGAPTWLDKVEPAPKVAKPPRPKKMPASKWDYHAVPVPGHVYVIQAGSRYKIGASTRIAMRLKEHAALIPGYAGVVLTVKLDDAFKEESRLHKLFAKKWLEGEWFALTLDDIARIVAMYNAD